MHRVLQGDFKEDQLRKDLYQILAEADMRFLMEQAHTRPLKRRNRALTILAHVKGISMREIASFLCVCRGAVRTSITRFKTGGVEQVLTLSRKETKRADDADYVQAVFRALHTPGSFGSPSAVLTPLLENGCDLSHMQAMMEHAKLETTAICLHVGLRDVPP